MASQIGVRYLLSVIVPIMESMDELKEDNEFESQVLQEENCLLNASRLKVSCISCISFSSCFWCSAMIRRSLISGDNGRGGESKRSVSGLERTKAYLLCVGERNQRKTARH